MDEKKAFLLLLSVFLLQCAVAKEEEIQAHVGTSVTLPCKVDKEENCGQMHSVKWYRDTARIYVVSYTGHTTRREGDATARMTVVYNTTLNETPLTISPVHMSDESTYKCEITYLEVRENCDVVQIVRLTTLVKPDDVHIFDYNKNEVEDNARLPPKDEEEQVELTCIATGKPIPTISWYKNSELTNATSNSTTKPGNFSGFGTRKSILNLMLQRSDLNARYECRVESQALNETMISAVTIDLRVRPTKMELSGGEDFVKQGDRITLTCVVYEARPEADVWWTNGTDNKLTNGTNGIFIETFTKENSDGTITTTSTLTFKATRWENEKYFYCQAKNEVMERKTSLLKQFRLLIVHYAPVITLNASATTLIETPEKTEEVTFTINYKANPQNLIDGIWLKDGVKLEPIEGKHFNGNKDNPTLQIKGISREDMGEYICVLKNEVGEERSEPVYLDVFYPPDVEVVMEPSEPVRATDQANVTLVCNVTDGNPSWLRKVRWFLDGDLMADLPECNYSQPAAVNETLGGPFCGIDPSILSLIKIDRTFAGNYTCQGQNDAGRYGPESRPRQLEVYYPPTVSQLWHFPQTVIKNGEVTLVCKVQDLGWPHNVTYEWHRGNHLLKETQTSNLTIPKASLETRSNFTCIAKNAGGTSNPVHDHITVLAPPAFIGNLNSYKGVLYSSDNVSLTCRIECYPECSIIWFKDGHRLDTENNRLYNVTINSHPADINKNDFESIESTLVWNMKNWPDQKLNKSAPHSHYTCAGISQGTQRPNVTFTTEIAIDFPPEDLALSEYFVSVEENKTPEPVKCSGKGRPKLSYVWKKNSTGKFIGKDDTLQLGIMSKSDAGNYTCEAFNKYGNKTINVYFNVKYKPECSIELGERDGKQVLICTATGNPQNISFDWVIHELNTTGKYKDTVFNQERTSYLFLDNTVDIERTYYCYPNNSVGSGECHRMVPGHIPWYRDTHNLVVVVASIVTLIICVIVVCVIIILLCRKKRQNAKSPNPSSTGDKMRLGAAPPVGGSADPANDHDKGFYENLPFHGMQNPPNKPYRPGLSDLDYADVDYKYGPINYKAASIYAAMKRNKNNNKMEEVNKPYDDLL